MNSQQFDDGNFSNINEKDYFEDYSLLISAAAQEFGGSFSSVSSPTLSKQETVTRLYESCIAPSSKWRQRLQTCKYLLQFPLRLFWHLFNLILISYAYRVRVIPKNCVYIRSWLVPQSFSKMGIRDEYFRDLTNDLENHEVVILALQPISYSDVWKINKAKFSKNYIIPIGLLRPIEIIKCLLDYILTAKISLSGEYIFQNKNISDKINLSLHHDYLGMRSFLAFLEKYIAQKLVDARIKSFIYVFENQSWEKSYCHIFQDNKIATIGYQSSGFSKRFLNFFPNQIDQRVQLQPHFILTVGEGFSTYLKQFAYYRSKILTFAALRFQHGQVNNKYYIHSPLKSVHYRVLYAFPVHLSQYRKIYDILLESFKDSKIQVDLKLHPLNVNKSKGIFKNLPQNFHIVEDINNQELSKKYDLMIFNDNSYGIESLIYGVKSYELDLFSNRLDERLIYFDQWTHRMASKDIKNLRHKIENSSFKKDINVHAINEYINYLYKPYTGDLTALMTAINLFNPKFQP